MRFQKKISYTILHLKFSSNFAEFLFSKNKEIKKYQKKH
jgi:hypothetical protein